MAVRARLAEVDGAGADGHLGAVLAPTHHQWMNLVCIVCVYTYIYIYIYIYIHIHIHLYIYMYT